jgi:hypothetical protein
MFRNVSWNCKIKIEGLRKMYENVSWIIIRGEEATFLDIVNAGLQPG